MLGFCVARRAARRRLPLALTFLLASFALARFSPAVAQPDNTPDQDCPPAPPAVGPAPPTTLCITLDARKSLDSLATPVTFRWRMGDGQVCEGPAFDYCYAKAGRYVVQLDVLDNLTGEVREHEAERIVDFTLPIGPEAVPALRFNGPDKAKIGEKVEFNIVMADLPLCLPTTVRYNWNFRDGLLGQGRSVKHVFRRAGTYSVRVALDGTLENGCLTRTCVTRAIQIEE